MKIGITLKTFIISVTISRESIGAQVSRTILAFILAGVLFAGTARGADQVTLSVTLTNYTGPKIPTDFLGLSYEKSILLKTSPPALPLHGLMLWQHFKNLGLRNLHIGGSSADGTNGAHPTDLEISNLFEFAQSSGVHVIYALQLLSFNLNTNLSEAGYVLTNSFTAPWLDYMACGNEPFFYTNPAVWIPAIPNTPYDKRITNYNSYLRCWESNANAVATAYPGTTFAAPDENIWGTNFIKDENVPTLIKLNTEHFYVYDGNNTNVDVHVADMLSARWPDTLYPNQYVYAAPWVAKGYPYRFTEMNDFNYVPGATDAFASALWVLDALQWWAANGIAANNFHNNLNNPSHTLRSSRNANSSSNFYIAPKGYAIKAFDLGGHGYSAATSLNSDNVDCYATVGGQDTYITIINKQYSGHGGTGGNTAAVTINLTGVNAASVRAMWLLGTNNDVEATNGTTLGSDTLTTNRQFVGGWQDLSPTVSGSCTVSVAIAQAAVVIIHAASAYSNPIQVNNNGTLEMFTVGTNGDVFHRWQNVNHSLDSLGSNPTNWVANYNDLGVLASGVTAAGGAVVARNQDGTLELFVPGSDGNVYDNYQITPSGSWSGWYNIGGSGVTNLQVGINRDGSLNLFGIGSDGDIWNNTETAPHILANNWTDWTDTAGVQPGIAVGQNLDGRLEVYGVTASGAIYHKYQGGTGSTGWSAWGSLGGNVQPPVQVGRDVSGALYVFALDAASNTVDYINQTAPGGGWTSWNTNSLTGETIQPGFVVGQNANGRFEIFGVGSNTDIWHNWIIGSGGWNGWADLGGTNSDPQLTVANSEDGRLQIWTIGQNGHIWSNWQTSPAGGWFAWVDFGGNGQIFYPGQ